MGHLETRLLDFVADQTKYAREKLRLETTLQEIGVEGDDADELFLAFAKEFAVDLSAFRIERHFHPESECMVSPIALLSLLVSSLTGRPVPPSSLEPVTVRDLVDAAASGKWMYSVK